MSSDSKEDLLAKALASPMDRRSKAAAAGSNYIRERLDARNLAAACGLPRSEGDKLLAMQRLEIDKMVPHPRTLLDPQTREVIAIAIGWQWAICDGRDPGDEDPRMR